MKSATENHISLRLLQIWKKSCLFKECSILKRNLAIETCAAYFARILFPEKHTVLLKQDTYKYIYMYIYYTQVVWKEYCTLVVETTLATSPFVAVPKTVPSQGAQKTRCQEDHGSWGCPSSRRGQGWDGLVDGIKKWGRNFSNTCRFHRQTWAYESCILIQLQSL